MFLHEQVIQLVAYALGWSLTKTEAVVKAELPPEEYTPRDVGMFIHTNYPDRNNRNEY